MFNIFIHLKDLPHTIPAFSVSNPDGSYTIIINAHLSHEGRMKAYKHELSHIQNNDHDKQCAVDEIELTVHNSDQ